MRRRRGRGAERGGSPFIHAFVHAGDFQARASLRLQGAMGEGEPPGREGKQPSGAQLPHTLATAPGRERPKERGRGSEDPGAAGSQPGNPRCAGRLEPPSRHPALPHSPIPGAGGSQSGSWSLGTPAHLPFPLFTDFQSKLNDFSS